ncbi:Ig-like domain-containing protein, partial [Metapseudomonas furukawaii]
MATQSIQLLLVDGKEVRQELPLVKGNKGNKGKAPTIKATPDGKFILADKETGLAPENITVRRVGKNLHVFLEGEPFEHPTVIIEDFFEYNCELVGMAEGGAYYPYVSSNGDDDFAGALALQDGESSALVLGGDMAAGDVDRTAFGLLPWIVGGALGAGAGVGAINSNSSGGSKSAPAPSAPAPIAPAPVLKHALDNEGSIQGVILSGGKTDDTTPTFAGTGQKPGNTISIYDNGKKIGETKVAEDGSWSFTPEKPLTEGKHSITFVERGADGRDSEVSKPFEFTVDTTAPEASPIGGILDDVGVKTGQLKPGESTDDQRPTLSGKTEGNAVVEIYDNGKKIGETRADAEGNWSFTPKEPLEEGEHSLTTRVIDEAGNVSDPSDSWDLVIDITPPVLPDNPISEILDNQGGIQGPIGENGHTDDNTPTIKGKGEPGDTVIILDNGEELDRVVIGPDGEWEYTPDPALEDGDHEISVIIEDPAGNQSEESPPWVINIDTQAPSAPSIGSVLDDIGTKTGELASGDLTDDSAPTFSGTAEAGATVVIYDNDVEIDRVTADKDGNWTYTPDPALAEGEHSITVRAIDAAGNMSLPSEVFELVIDTTPPVLPENPIGEILDNHGDIQGPIGEDGHTDDNTPTFKGKGEPGDTVIILDNGEEIGRVVVGPDLIWEFTPETELADGDHEISVIIEDPAGNQSEESPPRVIHVDTQAPDSPTIGKVEDNVGTKTDDLTSGDVTDDSTPTFSGKAEAGATVVIYDNDVEIDRVTSDKDGNWTYTPDPALAEGEHSITVRAVDAAGNVSDPSAIFELVIDTTAPVDPKNDGEGPGISEILDDHGAIQGPIDNGGLTDDNTPTIKGKGEPGDTIIILDNGEELDRVVVGPEGTWEYTPEAELADGEHAITVIIEDPAGNQSKESPEWVINIDATAPDAPTIDKVVDDAGTKTGDLTSGDITDDSTPTFSGKAEPNTTVVIYDNDKEIGRELVNEKGDWTFTPSKPLVGGDHSITVQAVDAAGNTSEHSEPAFEFTLIPPSQPVAPAITSVMDDVGTIQGPLQKNDVTDDARPTLSGTSAPGVSISVYSNGNLVGTTTANDQGQWTCTPDKDLTEGLNNLTVTATDLAGNIVPGSETGVYPLVLDITRPTAIDPDDLELLDDVGAIQGPINSGDTTDDAQPTFKGKSDEPFATVVIYDNGKEIARTETDAEGNWTFTPNPALDNGEHSLSVELIDRAGNVGDRSEPIDFTVDTRLVEVSIDSILDNHGVKQGPILKSGVTDDADPLLSGRATPDSIVVIYDNGEELIRTTSDANGNWSVTSPKLSEGDHALSASVITVAGGESARSPEFDFRLDLTKPDIDVHGIKEVIDDVGTVQGQIENGGFTDDTTPTLNGTGELGDTIHIYGNDDVLLDSVKVKPDGTWSYTTPPLEQGEHAFTVVIEDEAGNQSEKSAPWIINIDTTAPDAPTIDKVVDDAGTRTGDLTSGDVTDDTTPTLSGMAEKGATVVIYVNDVEIDRVTADPVTGAWAYTPTEENKLEEGEHRINVRAIDTAGNVSDPSETFELVIDTTAPVDPGIDPDGPGIGEVYDDHGDIQGPIDNGGLTDDATPT